MKFQDMPVPAPLKKALAARGYEEATPVQEAVAAPEHADGDLLVSSQTGSGKTVAFGLAVAPLILAGGERASRADNPLLLVVAPTRELALQVARELSWLYAPTGAQVATCVGGMDVRQEQRSLARGAHIVVGTPGRICDHLERGTLVVEGLAAVVLDEADEMLDMGFRDELERILATAPKERRTLMFSATLPKGIEAMAKKFTRDARRLTASSMAEPHQDIDYLAHLVAPREREHAVVNVLRFHDAQSTLVFCATRDGVSHLHGSLVERGFLAVAISGELSQAERNRALFAMREGRARVMVGTDVAARGLDLPAVGLVIHADLPHDGAVLQHRSGRTGRAGRKGTAVVLAPFAGRGRAERMAREAKVQLRWTPVPSPEQIQALDNQRIIDDLAKTIAEAEPIGKDVLEMITARFPPEAMATALLRMESRRLPAAEELPQTNDWADGPRGRDRRGPPERGGSRDRGGPRDRPAPRSRSSADERGGPVQRSGPVDRDGPGPRRGEGERGPPKRHDREDGVWFRVNVGRERKADVRWLIPMLCRRGQVNKRDLGYIEIRPRETRFQIAADMAAEFEAAAKAPDEKDPSLRIERMK